MELFDKSNVPRRADTWFVYALVDDREPEDVRYIGVTNNPYARLSLHLSQSSREGWKKSRWIQSVIAAGASIKMGILHSGLSQDMALSIEVSLIAEYKESGKRLMNLTDGGDGVKGQVQSPETRAKRSAALKGKAKSPEHGRKISLANTGRKQTDIARENMRSAHLKSYAENPERRERQRESTTARFTNPGERKRFSVLTSQRFDREGERERHSEIMRKKFSDNPQIVERRVLSQRMNGPQSNNTTGFKGVTFDKSKGQYMANIRVDKTSRFLGYYGSAEEAAHAYDAAATLAWGSACYRNFNAAVAA